MHFVLTTQEVPLLTHHHPIILQEGATIHLPVTIMEADTPLLAEAVIPLQVTVAALPLQAVEIREVREAEVPVEQGVNF